ncbi:replication restart helicase PriA [Pseudobacteriovorax antillogorgiicola]|uniref:Replication restart protein PriA n=1 Tax=Pseudobacteriovorax antillogorgiicola TaxID=1513793 RepID=A0A1Y6B2Q8_9BACT|nr:primosomal protein N' [Pseudobacteriovorax antillogorgiicola]TCS59413.1 replication restart DNA helicase PriA [Pseudobacteriovorax antillogorgiicola]SME88532.1 replication restart DNA helicase PriA [Pseudobacteriovorax antillogorgiicola]
MASNICQVMTTGRKVSYMSEQILLEIAVDTPLARTFTYSHQNEIPPGCRVMVPFGKQNRRVIGVVLGRSQTEGLVASKIKGIIERLDQEPSLSPVMLRLARWLADYYFHSIGEVLRAMMPASSKVKQKIAWHLTAEGRKAWEVDDHPHHKVVRQVFVRRSPLADGTFTKKISAIDSLGPSAAGAKKKMVSLGLVERADESKVKPTLVQSHQQDLPTTPEPPKNLTVKQTEVFSRLQAAMKAEKKKAQVLWGVTGAGKTEIYLQLIADCFRFHRDSQALVLVPEISLTPQMTMIFERRFPGLVSVVHSALDQKERWHRLEAIRTGAARILVGPRSAVFGPFRNLGLVICDEEHDSSYKQSSGLQYHGRDVAVLRGQMEQALVVLGSATPSIETMANVRSGKYEILELLERVHQRALPEITVLEQKAQKRRGQTIRAGLDEGEIPVHEDVIAELRQNVEKGEQSIVIVNRRGYAYFLFHPASKKTVSCPQCSVSLTVHKKSQTLKCHYCEYQKSLSAFMGSDDEYLIVGYGSEQAESFLRRQLPGARVVRVDSDTVAKKGALEDILRDFRQGKIDILVGTQILAKGHDFPNVTLICLLEVDQMLQLPDFRAGERAFQLMVQAAGRAGRAELSGRVLLQTQKADDPIIRFAVAQDYRAFAEFELGFREAHQFPPFYKMVHIEFNSPEEARLEGVVSGLQDLIQEMLRRHESYRRSLSILGPIAPPIEMIRGRIRRSLILTSKEPKDLWSATRFIQLSCSRLPSDVRMKIDVDPQSIL